MTAVIHNLLRDRPQRILLADTSLTRGSELISLVAVIAVFGFTYGIVMGAFGGLGPDRWLQITYSGLKTPLLLLATFALSVPPFFVLYTLIGLRDDFGEAVRALLATQAGLTIVLASLGPMMAVTYLSNRDYDTAVSANFVCFGAASLSAQYLLRRFYRPLIDRDRRHRPMLWAWLAIYGFVGIQMGWSLRPFIGAPGMSTRFLREDDWGNAYQALLNKLTGTLGL
ncbi:MAG: hypothetical protein AAF797_10860 [Planctomycetota bacterium]